MNAAIGQVVYSIAGRDTGKVFVITQVIDINYVLVSDGDLRRVEKPKKKKIRHLKFSSIIVDSIAQKINCGMKLTNADIRKALTDIKNKEDKK